MIFSQKIQDLALEAEAALTYENDKTVLRAAVAKINSGEILTKT